MILLLILSLTCTPGGQGGPVPTGSGLSSDTSIPTTQSVCQLQKAKEDFDLSKFLGKWYVLEYIYDKPKKMKAFSCIGFEFSKNEDSELKSNFTFKFPAKTGFYYHVPSYSPVNTIIPAIWDTKHRGEKLTSMVVDTDYSQWAVLTQCKKSSNTSSQHFLSTRILSRSRVLPPEHLKTALDVMKKANPEAAFQYRVDQMSCEPRKKKTKISAIIKKMRAIRKTWTTTAPSTEKSDKKSRISAIIKKMREMRKKWTTPQPSTTETMVSTTQDTYELLTQSPLALELKDSASQNIDNTNNGSWRFDSNNFLYILLLHICTYLNSC